MKKIILLAACLLIGKLSSAQDYILKNLVDHFTIMQNGHGISINGDNIQDSQGVYFLKGTGTVPADSNLVHIRGTETILGAKTFKTTTIVGSGTATQTLDVIAPGNTDALRFYSLNNPSGGSVNPPSLGFYRSGSTVNALPRFRITGNNMQGLDGDGFGLTSPASNINWIIGDIDGGSPFGMRTGSNNGVALGLLQQTYFTSGTTVFGLDLGAESLPIGGMIRSGAKTFGTPTDVGGSDLSLSGGGGTGAGTAGGNLLFQTPDATSSGSSFQAYTTKMQLQRSGSLALGTTTEDHSALLLLQSTTRGFLLPRLTAAQEAAIATPAAGLQVYNTTGNTIDYYNGTAWTSLGSGGSSGGSGGATGLAVDSTVVHLKNTETISGQKTFSADATFRTFTLGYGGGNISSNMLLGTGFNSGVTGTFNLGVGGNVMTSLSSGVWNLAVMNNALKLITTGSYNEALGINAIENNTTGSDNIGIGRRAFQNITTGTGNIGLGSLSGYAASSASSFNILLGTYAGYNGTIGSGNVFIGTYAGNGASGDNQFILANGNLSNTSPTPLLSGNFSTGQLALPTAPATSAGSYQLLTRNTTTGALESVGSGRKVILGDANGNIVMTNKIITADGKDIYKTPGGNWKYVHYNDDGTQVVDSATVTIDGSGNATVTTP